MVASTLSRRAILGLLGATPLGVATFSAWPAQAQSVPTNSGEATGSVAPMAECVGEDLDGMRGSLGYVEVSPYGVARDCRNCEFWRVDAGATCGGCTLMEGTISPIAYCDSWALAPGAVG